MQIKKIRRELEEYKDGKIGDIGSKIGTGDATPAAEEKNESGTTNIGSAQADQKSLKEKLAVAQNGVDKYSRAADKLGSAEQKLQGAVQSLSFTQVSGMVGMMGPRRGRGMVGRRNNNFGHTMIEMGTVRKAQAAVQQAGADIRQAQQLVPQLPYVKDANVQQAMSGVMLNALLMPGFAGDVMQQAKVTRAKRDIQETLEQVVQSKQWCMKSVSAAQADAAQLTAEIGKMAL